MRAATPLDQPRAIGTAVVSSKKTLRGSVIDGLRQSGAYKLLFPRRADALETIIINTSGGVTGGDAFHIEATAGIGSRLVLTTQAAERGYRTQHGQKGRIFTRLAAEAQSTLHWLPQETILYDGSAIDRRLSADLAATARFLMVESVLFGRRAMGEDVNQINFRDRIDIRRDGKPLFRDGLDLSCDAAQLLNRPAIGQGARAMASHLYVAPDAAGRIDDLRRHLDQCRGASLLDKDVLVARLLAEEGFNLRCSLLPILEILTQNALPQSRRL